MRRGYTRSPVQRGTTRSRNRTSGIASVALRSITCLHGLLQSFDPAQPRFSSSATQLLGRVGYLPEADDTDSGFDVIWCQWCLGHVSDTDLLAFFARGESVIVVKEDVCGCG